MKFLADENFDNRILRGLLRRRRDLDVVRVQDLEIAGADDPTVLAWAAREGRILLTHDQKTIPRYTIQRIETNQAVAGVIIVNDTLPIGTVIDNILLIVECSSASEWVNQIQRLPI